MNRPALKVRGDDSEKINYLQKAEGCDNCPDIRCDDIIGFSSGLQQEYYQNTGYRF